MKLSSLLFAAFGLFAANGVAGGRDDNPYPREEHTADEAALISKWMVGEVGHGTLNTINTGKNFEGYPYSAVTIFTPECGNDEGDLILFLSDLAHSVENIKEDNQKVSIHVHHFETKPDPLFHYRVTLMGDMNVLLESERDAARACYFARWKETKMWDKMTDFKWYRFSIKGAHWIGGFGGQHFIGWIDEETYRRPNPKNPPQPPKTPSLPPPPKSAGEFLSYN